MFNNNIATITSNGTTTSTRNKNYFDHNNSDANNYRSSSSSSSEYFNNDHHNDNTNAHINDIPNMNNNFININSLEGTNNLVATSSQQTNYIHVNSIHQHHHHYHLQLASDANQFQQSNFYCKNNNNNNNNNNNLNKSFLNTNTPSNTNTQQLYTHTDVSQQHSLNIESPPSSIINDMIVTDEIVNSNLMTNKNDHNHLNQHHVILHQQQLYHNDLNNYDFINAYDSLNNDNHQTSLLNNNNNNNHNNNDLVVSMDSMSDPHHLMNHHSNLFSVIHENENNNNSNKFFIKDSNELDQHQRSLKALTPSRSKMQCQVCGDKSSGFHFGVYTCEACKGFFRRCNKKFKPSMGPCAKQCLITKETRNNCARCRFERCLNVGMAVEKIRFGKTPKHISNHNITHSSESSIASNGTLSTNEHLMQNYTNQAIHAQNFKLEKLLNSLLNLLEQAKEEYLRVLSNNKQQSTDYSYYYDYDCKVASDDILIRLKESILFKLNEFVHDIKQESISCDTYNLNQNTTPLKQDLDALMLNERNGLKFKNQLTPPLSQPPSSAASSTYFHSTTSIQKSFPEVMLVAYSCLVLDECQIDDTITNKNLQSNIQHLFSKIYMNNIEDSNILVKTLHFLLILVIHSQAYDCSNDADTKVQKVLMGLLNMKCRDRLTRTRILLSLDNFIQL